MSLAMLSTVDRFAWPHIQISLPLIPATLLGYWFAMKTCVISHQRLRTASLFCAGLQDAAPWCPTGCE